MGEGLYAVGRRPRAENINTRAISGGRISPRRRTRRGRGSWRAL